VSNNAEATADLHQMSVTYTHDVT